MEKCRRSLKDIYLAMRTLSGIRHEHGREAMEQALSKLRVEAIKVLSTTEDDDKYMFVEVEDELKSTLTKNGQSSPHQLHIAFMCLVNYALNLLIFPWKKEYRTIKTYGGNYRVRIKAVFQKPQKIFNLLGYVEKDNSTIQLIGPLNKDMVLDVAVCCFVASCELELIAAIDDSLDQEYSYANILRCRQQTTGNVKECGAWITFHCSPKTEEMSSAIAKGFGLHNGSPLQQKFKPYSADHADSSLGIMQQELPLDQVMSFHDGHFNVPQTSGNLNLDITPDEDLYEPASLDQHLEKSLQVFEKEKKKEVERLPAFDETPVGDWSFVYKKLEQTHGKDYFIGERGDITAAAHFNPYGGLPMEVTVDGRGATEQDDRPPPIIRQGKVSDSGIASHSQAVKGDVTQTSERGLWECSQCTVKNEPSARICSVCSSSRLKTSSPGKCLTSGGPECPKCTLVNSIGAAKCVACDNPLAGSPTYI